MNTHDNFDGVIDMRSGLTRGTKKPLKKRGPKKRLLWATVLAVVLSALVCACAYTKTAETPEDHSLTQEEQKDSDYSFLTHQSNEPSAIPTVFPNWDPDLVIPLDGLEPYEPEPMIFERHTGDVAEYIYAMRFKPDKDDGFTVEVYRSTDGSIYAALAVSGTEHDCFMEIEYDVSADQISLEWYDNVCGQSGFCVTYPVATGTYLSAYYYFDENHRLYQLLNDSCRPMEIDLDGNGQKELLWKPLEYLEYNDEYLYLLFQRDSRIYKTEIKSLIRSEWPDAGHIEGDGRLSIQVPVPGSDIMVTVVRTLWFDGENLRLYRDETPYEDRVKAGIEAPPDVLAAARDIVQGKFNAMAGGDADGYGSAIWDDWRITELTGWTYYETVEEIKVEIWSLGYEIHTATPDRVLLAGKSYLGEDDWYAINPRCNYLYFELGGNGNRTVRYALKESDYSPGTEPFREDLIRALKAGGFLPQT